MIPMTRRYCITEKVSLRKWNSPSFFRPSNGRQGISSYGFSGAALPFLVVENRVQAGIVQNAVLGVSGFAVVDRCRRFLGVLEMFV